jgi:rhamnogalacturonyl hydrolase YesR
MKRIVNTLMLVAICLSSIAKAPKKSEVLEIAEKVFEWQENNPTGVKLWKWHYGAYYSGLADLYMVDPQIQYLEAMVDMGNAYEWKFRPRAYDANVYAIGHMYLDMYSILKDPKLIENLVYNLDFNFDRTPRTPDVSFDGNRYWWSWWSWCDALFMAPPTFAKYAKISGDEKYLKKMDELWTISHNYLYDKEEQLYFRDDRFFTQKSPNGKKIFWSRGNGWVHAGLVKVLQAMPEDYVNREFYVDLYIDMAKKLKSLQLKEGYWPSSLLDPSHYGGIETSGTAFFCYSLAYGINSGLLKKEEYYDTVMKAWDILVKSVHPSGKLGYVQQVGDSPKDVSFNDSEAYGAGAFMSAASEVYKLLEK